jgi:dipeptidyl aminopeptidase/acylaminoacyl peptidase
MQTLEGVMPSVDEAVRLGITDEKRLALIGHSFGEYGAYALVTQTNRFKAAIGMGGFANLVSLCGQFDPRAREEFFTALFRQNKPAVFVRYWGEGHILESPANITDLWKRIYQWLERYLASPLAPSEPASLN